MYVMPEKKDKERNQQNYILLVSEIGKRPLGRPTRGWQNNIKIDLRQDGAI
jgi:hypothetical protein